MLRNIKHIRKITFVALMACLMILSNIPLGAFELVFKELAETTRDRKIVDMLYLSQKEGRDGNIVDNLMIPQARAAVAANSARTFYGVTNNAGRLMWATGASNSTGAEIAGPVGSASNIAFMKALHSPVGDEVMAGHIKLDGRLDIVAVGGAQDATGDAVAQFNKTGVASTMACDTAFGSCWRPFDIAYEQLSGQTMVAFGLNASAGTLQYCSWNGSAWTPASCTTPSTFTLTGSTGALRWVRLIPRGEGLKNSRSDEILMIASDANSDIFAAIWNGSSWGNLTTITTGASTFQIQNFDGAWEETSGDAVVVWSEGTGASTQPFRYKQWTRSSTTWDGSGTVLPTMGASHIGHWVAAKTAPVSGKDHIAVITNSATTMGNNCATTTQCRAQPFIWNGSGFTLGNEWTSQEPVWQQIANVAVESLNSNVQAFFSSSNGGGTDLSAYQTWIEGTGFSAITDLGGAMGDDAAGIQLTAHPNSNEVFITGEDVDADCNGNLWNGGASGTWDITGCNSAGELALAPVSHTAQPSEGFAPWVVPKIYSPWSQNWRWYDDEASATPATPLANENTTATIDQGNIVRLRFQAAELSGTAISNSRKKLQYTSCADPNASSCTWTDVDAQGGAGIWRYADGGGADDATFTSIVLTGSDANGVYVENGTAASTFGHGAAGSASDIPEWDYAIANNSVPTGTTYYFRMYDNDQLTAVFRNQVNGSATYSYPSAMSAIPSNNLTVSSSGAQATNLNSGDTAQHIGGGATAAFQLQMSGSAVNVNSVKLTEQGGSITLSDLTSQKLYHESAATCTYEGNESNISGTPVGETVTFSFTSVSIPTSNYLCLYYIFDLDGTNAVGGETIDIEITDPSTDVVLASGQNTDTAAKQLSGTTTVKPQITGYTNSTDAGLNYAGSCTGCGARIGSSAVSLQQRIVITGSGFGSDPGLGSRDTASNKVEIVGTSTTLISDNGAGNSNINTTDPSCGGGAIWTPTCIVITTDTTVTGNADADWGTNYGGASALKVTIGGQSVPTNLNYYIFPQVSSIASIGSPGAREYDSGDTDGVITINGTRFGATQGSGATGGYVKILGCDSSACPGAADGSVTIDSWGNTQISARVPTVIGDGGGGVSDYVGNLTVRQGASTNNKTHSYTNSFRILPRITSITPSADGVNPNTRTLNGNHFCQSGSCLSAALWNAAADDGDDVKFGTTNATVTGTPSNTAVAVTVPSLTPGNYSVTLSSSSYASNGKNFSYLDNTPVNPSSLNQYQSNCSTVITDETTTASSTVCLKGAVSGGITGGTLYLQVEVRDSATAFTAATAESAGVSAPAGGTESVSVTPGQGIFKWRARTCHYNNVGTHNLTCTGTGDYPSAAWVEFETGAVPTNDFTIDSNGPAIIFGSATPSEFTAAIVWTTDEAAVSRVNYGKTASYGFTLPKGTAVYTTNYVTSHTASISTNLTCGTLYHYQILVKDNQSNITADSDRTFTTSSCTNRIMRTIDYPISQETIQVSSFPTTLTRQFDAYIEEASPTVRNAYVEIEGISAGNSSMTLTAEVKKCNDAGCSSTTSGASRIYTLPASGSGPQPFKILHPIATSSTFSSAGCPGSCPTAITVDYPNNFLAGQIVQLTDYSGAPAESKTILTVTGSNKDVITFTTALANNYSALSTVVSKEFEPQDVAGSKNPNQLVMTLGAGPTNVSIIGAKLVVTYNYNP